MKSYLFFAIEKVKQLFFGKHNDLFHRLPIFQDFKKSKNGHESIGVSNDKLVGKQQFFHCDWL